MRVWGKWILLMGIAVLGVAQFIPVARTNPPVDSSKAMAATLPVPAQVSAVLDRACQDCHSNRTVWPWYSQIAPISWFVVHDVNEGRRELNFSDWGRYTARRQDRKLKEICEQVDSGKMPMAVYTLMHPQSKLAPSDKKTLCEWTAEARKTADATTVSAARP